MNIKLDTKKVFLSYSRKDEAKALQLRQALRGEGIEVWWDEEIMAGETWNPRIDAQLRDASSVVVLWTENSVNSEWVKHEASVAKANENLIGVRIDDVTVPSVYDGIQLADLRSWDGREDHSRFRKLVGDIEHNRKRIINGEKIQFPASLIKPDAAEQTAQPHQLVSSKSWKRPAPFLALLGLLCSLFAIYLAIRNDAHEFPEIQLPTVVGAGMASWKDVIKLKLRSAVKIEAYTSENNYIQPWIIYSWRAYEWQPAGKHILPIPSQHEHSNAVEWSITHDGILKVRATKHDTLRLFRITELDVLRGEVEVLYIK